MKVTALYVYPIKALRGIKLDSSRLGSQGLAHDRHFMICEVAKDGQLKRMQLAGYPQCALFAQEIVSDEEGQGDGGAAAIHVRYMTPEQPLTDSVPLQSEVLKVPLQPDLDGLDRAEVNVHNSLVLAYRMGPQCDKWFSACFGFDVALLYIGDQRRPVLGTFSPKSQVTSQQSNGWLSSISSLVLGGGGHNANDDEPDWINFSDVAPYLIATDASLANVSARLSDGDMDMYKFRPNIVVDGDTQWDEDFWSQLELRGAPTFALTKMCHRCTSVNVDYDTGRPAEGERGAVLKKLMSDRRVDLGAKYSPVFGRYAFLVPGVEDGARIAVGDDVGAVGRADERPVWDWPMKDPAAAQYYQKAY